MRLMVSEIWMFDSVRAISQHSHISLSHYIVPRKGRKKPLALGQIGIGCVFCKGSSTKLKGCSYFPSSISGIYNATMIIQQRHFPVCPSVTKWVYSYVILDTMLDVSSSYAAALCDRTTYCEYNKLKGLTARSASTKEYWISSAKKLVSFADTY